MSFAIYVNDELYVNEVFATKDSAISFMNVEFWDVQEFEVRQFQGNTSAKLAKVYNLELYREVYRERAELRKKYGGY